MPSGGAPRLWVHFQRCELCTADGSRPATTQRCLPTAPGSASVHTLAPAPLATAQNDVPACEPQRSFQAAGHPLRDTSQSSWLAKLIFGRIPRAENPGRSTFGIPVASRMTFLVRPSGLSRDCAFQSSDQQRARPSVRPSFRTSLTSRVRRGQLFPRAGAGRRTGTVR